jgi:uncharacterized RDD family membrane protein YckC
VTLSAPAAAPSPFAPPAAAPPAVSPYAPSPYAPPAEQAAAGTAVAPPPPPPAYAPAAATGWPPAAPGHAGPEYAGFWRRFWGLCIDRFALGVVLFPVGLALGFRMMWPFAHHGELTADALRTMLFGSLSMWLIRSFAEWVYFAAFQGSSRQATPGQMVLGIRVTGLDGGPIGFGRATGRYFASWLSAMVLLIGFIMAAFTERKQALHDILAGTLVVRGAGPR